MGWRRLLDISGERLNPYGSLDWKDVKSSRNDFKFIYASHAE